MNFTSLGVVVALALGIAPAAMTLTMAPVFRDLRVFIARRSSFLGGLFGCPYCMSHWLALFGVLFFRPVLVPCPTPYVGPILEVLLSAFAVVMVNAPLAYVIFKAYAPMKPPPEVMEDDE